MKSILLPPETISDASGLGLREEVIAEWRSIISLEINYALMETYLHCHIR